MWKTTLRKYIKSKEDHHIGNVHHHHHHFTIITSDLMLEPPSLPPLIRILPPTIDARARYNVRGREARGVQVVAPWRRVTTEEVRPDGVRPPATMNACTKGWFCFCLTLVIGRAAQAWRSLFSGSWGSSSTKPFTPYLQRFAVLDIRICWMLF